MQKEFCDRSSTVLREKLTSWGISAVAFDFDGTLINTKDVFNQAILGALTAMGKADEEARQLKEMYFDKIIWALRPELGVNPAIMELSTIIMAKILGLEKSDEQTQKAIHRVREIYTHDVPELIPGAKETVLAINTTGARTILVTHAQEEWTWNKLTGTKMTGMFAHIACMSILRSKSAQWEVLLNKLGIDPSTLLVIGDNFDADIAKPVEFGARAFYIDTGRFGAFGSDKEINPAESIATGRVVAVSDIAQVIPRLLSLDKDDWRN